MRATQRNRMFIFYFGGHAYLRDGLLRLCPVDYVHGEMQTEVDALELVGFVQRSHVHHAIIILDCCFANELGKLPPLDAVTFITPSKAELKDGSLVPKLIPSLRTYVGMKSLTRNKT